VRSGAVPARISATCTCHTGRRLAGSALPLRTLGLKQADEGLAQMQADVDALQGGHQRQDAEEDAKEIAVTEPGMPRPPPGAGCGDRAGDQQP